ncbi:MAG: UPF0182 family protein [Chloroflexota bacterium]
MQRKRKDSNRTVEYRPAVKVRDLVSPDAFFRYFLGSSAVAAFAAVFIFLLVAVHVHVNIWWFESLGLGGVYGRMWETQKFLFLTYGILTYLFLTLIFFGTRAGTYRPGPSDNGRAIDGLLTVGVGFATMLIAMVAGSAMGGQWQAYLLAHHAQSFGMTDPIHHRDIGFYVFTMPWRQIQGDFAVTILVVGALDLAALATIYTTTSPYETERSDIRRIIAIASLFGAVLFGYFAWRNFFLYPFNLGQPGRAYGGGATFVHASLWWYPIVGTVEIVAAVVLLVNTILRRTSPLFVAILPLLVGTLSSAGQGIFQHFVVTPNELSAEYPYLGYTLHFTRHAYGMDGWAVRQYTPKTLSSRDVAQDRAALAEARIADAGVFTQVIRQRQENRSYYTFNDANIDRYTVDHKLRQVVVAARELQFSQLNLQAQTWVNEHIKFTHGYGLAMSPANMVGPTGQPLLWIQNVPVQETIQGLPAVAEPRIYFGQSTDAWILTHATTPEFDSSTSGRDMPYTYGGQDGVPVGGGLRRLSLSWELEGGVPFLNKLNISNYVGPSTRVLLHRNIIDRVHTIAPWLTLDSKPYLVLRPNGTLVWMLDGLTHADHYPYSEPIDGDNYRRNSVKIVIDAYTGRTDFYAFGPPDPLLQAWSSVFPGLIQPFARMPRDLVAHIKYPDDYLNWQASAYQRYHVTDITSYYNADNEWDVESAQMFNWNDGQLETNTLDPIWTVTRLFGGPRDRFFSILPFSVHTKQTMAGYLAADNDSYHVTALNMPRGAQTMGVTQFQSLYSQAPAISSTITLLDQHGSQIVPGQVLVLPVGSALLYMQPLYLRSSAGQSLPQLNHVVVGTQNEVNWNYTLASAVNSLLTFGDISTLGQTQNGVSPVAPPSPASTAGTGHYSTMTTGQLIARANALYRAAQTTPSLTAKDRDLQQLGAILRALQVRSGR